MIGDDDMGESTFHKVIVELSTVIQGEGQRMGRISSLVRLTGCPLRCKFGDNYCDSINTSWAASVGKYDDSDAVKFIKDNVREGITDVIITGGEPLMRPLTVINLLREINLLGDSVFTTIETNGVYDACRLGDLPRPDKLLFSVSPKLKNSVPDGEEGRSHDIMRINYNSLSSYTRYNHQFKFVIKTIYDIDEAVEISDMLDIIHKGNIWLMPEGVSKAEIDFKRRIIIEQCLLRGFNYSDRLHILAFGNIGGV